MRPNRRSRQPPVGPSVVVWRLVVAGSLPNEGSSATRGTESPEQDKTVSPSIRQQAEGTVPGSEHQPHRLGTVGIYVTPPGCGESHHYDFYRACGYNYLEFCDGGFGRRPDLLPRYYAEMTHAIDTARGKGFKVWILLLAGMKQWQGPGEAGYPGTFSALNAELLHERLARVRQAIQELRAANGFVFFAGDPGGDPEGRSTVHDCSRFARRVQKIVAESAPAAQFAVNLWAVAEWAGFPSPFSLEFWRQQVVLSKAMASEEGLLGPDCGVAFSLDNYYRSLALACYADAGIAPERYPLAADVRQLRQRGVRPVYGWPYFLVDEVDDGFITPNNVASGGQSQAETRYLRAIIDQSRELRLDGLITNAAFVAAEALNIYAFGRMCQDATLTPEALLDEYAGIIADEATWRVLASVLRFIENHSNWQNSLPRPYRLRDFDCGDVTSVAVAKERLATVVPRATPPIPLPEPPAPYLKRLGRRLEAIAAGKIGGVAPIVRRPPTR